MNRIDFVNSVKPKIQFILNRVFRNEYNKRVIKMRYSSLNFACPYCGDSTKDSTKKRGNLILTGKFANTYKCFNCGHFNSLEGFVKDFSSLGKEVFLTPNELTYIKQVAENDPYSIQNQSKQKTTYYNSLANKNLELVNYISNTEVIDKFAIDKSMLFGDNTYLKIVGLEDERASGAVEFLRRRHQIYQHNLSKFAYSVAEDALVILNLTESNKVLGLQLRTLKKDYSIKYKTYKIDKLYNLLKLKVVDIPPHLYTISNIFNIMLIDFLKPIVVTEGPLDSFLIQNAIATSSAMVNPPDILEEYYYMYDSDKTGIEHSKKKLKQGEYVFMWSKFCRDMKLPYRKKWDWNDFLVYGKEKGLTPPSDLLSYFTKEKMDVMYL